MTLPKSFWSTERSRRREGDPTLDQNLLTGIPPTVAHHIRIPNPALGPDHHAPTLGQFPDLGQDPAHALVPDHAPTLAHHTPAGAEVEAVAIDLGHALQHTIAPAVDRHRIGAGR